MAPTNADTLRGMIEDFNAGGVEAALAHVHPEITWNAPPDWLEQSVYTGHEGIRALATAWEQNFEEYRVHVERVTDLGGGRALALLHQRGTIRGSGVEVEQPVAWIAEIREAQLVKVDVFFSWEAGLEAARPAE